ncbi:MAG: glycosyltransferase, partial [Candidatus Hydrogenedentes bacterium]|nr:glycosyltransferase [Candidatus Hydrogenedentota bacterium]
NGIILAICVFTLIVVLWNCLRWPSVRPQAISDEEPSIAILIPARNEELNIGTCLEAAIQQGPCVGEIIVYNDHSIDATGAIVEQYRARDARVRLATPADLPPDWFGKPFACWRLAKEARMPWLLFLDADTEIQPGAAAGLLHEAVRRNATLLSAWPFLVTKGFWEQLLMPMLNFLIISSFPAPLSLKMKYPSLGVAHGACILANREAYFRVGGHEAVKNEILEDLTLARTWRKRGEWGICLDGKDVVHVRMYTSLGEIWRGFQKNFYAGFPSSFNFWGFVVSHVACFILPFVAAPIWLQTGTPYAWMAVGSVLAALATRLALSLRFRHPVWSILFHPFGEAFLVMLGVYSWWLCVSGKGVSWKGRAYQVGAR